MKMYIDANREASYNYPNQDGWTTITNYKDFKKEIEILVERRKGWVDIISLDYELGDKSGADCLEYLVDACIENNAPLPKIYCHSEWTGAYIKFENLCDKYQKTTERQYVLESRRKYR